LATV
jgi:hypothetical protein